MQIHAEILNPDEVEGIRSYDLLVSACQSPQDHWHYSGQDDIVKLATILLLKIALNHPFIDGNKRSAFVAMKAFIEENGYVFAQPDGAVFGDVFIGVLEHEVSPEILESMIRSASIPI